MSFGMSSNRLLCKFLSTKEDSLCVCNKYSTASSVWTHHHYHQYFSPARDVSGKNQSNPSLNLALRLLMSKTTSIYDFSSYIRLMRDPDKLNLFPFHHLRLICDRTAKEKANFPWSQQNKRAVSSVCFTTLELQPPFKRGFWALKRIKFHRNINLS